MSCVLNLLIEREGRKVEADGMSRGITEAYLCYLQKDNRVLDGLQHRLEMNRQPIVVEVFKNS